MVEEVVVGSGVVDATVVECGVVELGKSEAGRSGLAMDARYARRPACWGRHVRGEQQEGAQRAAARGAGAAEE